MSVFNPAADAQNPGTLSPDSRGIYADHRGHDVTNWIAIIATCFAGIGLMMNQYGINEKNRIDAETELAAAQTALLAEKGKVNSPGIALDFYTGPALQLGIVRSVGAVGKDFQVMYSDIYKNCKLITIPGTATPPKLGDVLGKTFDGDVKIVGQEPIAPCNRETSSMPLSLGRY
ncbi:MAG TPA: hypothetical protein VGZ00_06230 [Candidatus Baltobacteraceae bacterium]|jgi:hypothetical protein|nr:hypothetical protein [Candidatus Baltobacteraceae bacterium]